MSDLGLVSLRPGAEAEPAPDEQECKGVSVRAGGRKAWGGQECIDHAHRDAHAAHAEQQQPETRHRSNVALASQQCPCCQDRDFMFCGELSEAFQGEI
eukprot:2687335-Rhodomonas_salina.2